MILKIEKLIKEGLLSLGIDYQDNITIEAPKNRENGDFSTNICLKISKLNNVLPMDLAKSLQEFIKFPELIKTEVKNPGFINFFVEKKYLINNISVINTLKDNYGKSNKGQGIRINYEYVSANPTGILHTGNARGGAYGDNMSRILSFLGYEVTKEYYINDAGNQVNNLGLSIQARYFEKCNLNFSLPKDGYYGNEIIKLANELFEKEGTNLIDKNIEYFVEYGVSSLISKIISDLKLYGVEFDKLTSEKDIYVKYPLEKVINNLTEKGYTYEKEGALWLKSSQLLDDKDHVLLKSDGTYTYLVPDIAYHIDKINRGYNRLVNILGTDHHGYVNRIKSGIMAMGYDPKILDIKLLQLVKLIKDGQELKMSKRTGNSLSLRELIEEIGVNAARYYFAARSLDSQMEIDLDNAIKKSNENPVYYVSYAYARICTILNNNSYEVTEELNNLKSDQILPILELIYDFPRIVEDAANKEIPHLITNYVYDLATSFHYLYNEYRFVCEDEKLTNENLNLLLAVKITMYNALSLIGVNPPEKM